MESKKSNLMMLTIFLAVFPMYVLTGCKKKVQSATANSSGTSTKNQTEFETFGSEQLPQTREMLSYSSEDEEEYDEEEPNDEDEDEDEPEDDSDESDDEEDYEEDYSDDDEDSNDYDDEQDDNPDEDSSDSWY